ncbi:MAG: VWA domain-containing protein [Pseudomonadota bacterium]
MIGRFLADTRGNVLMMVTFAIIPIIGIAGAGLDFSRTIAMRTNYQGAADNAALAAALIGGPKTTPMKDNADLLFDTNIDGELVANVTARELAVNQTGAEFRYAYTVNFAVPTTFLSVLGINSLSGSVNSSAVSSANKAEIALVLDSTGSMGTSNRMNELKTAVQSFFDKFEPKADVVKISVVPFDTQVRLDGIAFGNGNLDNVPNPYDPDTDCSALSGEERTICLSVQASCTASSSDDDDDDDDDDEGGHSLPAICSITPQSSKTNDTISANNDLLGATSVTWSGCVIDRVQPYDTSASPAVGSNVDTLYPTAHCATNNLEPIRLLTNNFTQLRSTVRDMTPSGNTNLTIGLQWGMETLTRPLPFDQTTSHLSSEEVTQTIILVTDGNNTQNRWTTNTGDIDARTELACTAAKTMGVTVYTIRVTNGNATLLGNCASTSDHFFDVQNASQLEGVFDTLAARLNPVRLTN